MTRPQLNRLESWALVILALLLIILAFVFYPGRSGARPSLHGGTIPGWFDALLFIFIGVLMRLGYVGGRRWRQGKDAQRNTTSKT